MKKNVPDTVSKGSVDVRERLRELNKSQRHAVLATDAKGQPYTSLISYALTPDLKGLLFATPKDTSKYRNMLRNKKVSILIDTRQDSDLSYMEAEAITVLGTAQAVRKGKKRDALAGIFLQKHPALKGFINSPATALILVEIHHCFHVGSFQKISEWHP